MHFSVLQLSTPQASSVTHECSSLEIRLVKFSEDHKVISWIYLINRYMQIFTQYTYLLDLSGWALDWLSSRTLEWLLCSVDTAKVLR